MSGKLRIKSQPGVAITITRDAFEEERLVYIGCANKPLRYKIGRSRIAYIGCTRTGAKRVAASAVWKGADVLFDHGIKRLDFHIVVCTKRQRLATWKKLEAALLIRFRECFGEVPRGNDQGKKLRWSDEKQYFEQAALDKVVSRYS